LLIDEIAKMSAKEQAFLLIDEIAKMSAKEQAFLVNLMPYSTVIVLRTAGTR
jgi:replication-associated recombination protein RarA